MKTVGLALLIGTVATVTACESLSRGTWQDLSIQTTPAGALVLLSDGQSCTSPCRLRVARYHEVAAKISLNGCRTPHEMLSPTVRDSDSSLYRTVYDYQLGGAYDVEPAALSVPLVCGEAAKFHPPGLTAHDEALLGRFEPVTSQQPPGTIP